jgi:hypothetical protein
MPKRPLNLARLKWMPVVKPLRRLRMITRQMLLKPN